MGSSANDAVSAYLDLYGASDSSLAWLLCDRYACEQVAFRVIDADLSSSEVTYGSLRDRSERFARALSLLGVEPGDRVATLMGKREEYLVSLLAIWRLGAVHVPLFTAFAPPAIATRLRRSGAKVVVTETAQRQKLAGLAGNWAGVTVTASGGDVEGQAGGDIDFDECVTGQTTGFKAAVLGGQAPFIHTFTSGTTGEPKGVVVPARALAAFRVYVEYAIGLQHDDLYWNAADPGWAYGLYFGVLGSLATGVTSVLARPGFSAAFTWSVLSAFPITNFAAAPTVYRSLRAWHKPEKGSVSLRCASSAGEPLTPEVNEWAPDALGTRVYDHYGQTEAGMLINNHHHAELERDVVPRSMGVLMPGWEGEVLLRDQDAPAPIGTVGRVAMRLAGSPLAWFDGYDDEPEKSLEKFSTDGQWYLTGDAGKRDEGGNFFFSCRDDDVIITAGYRIGSFEIESIIANHPAVEECAVIAAPDEIRGEVIEAYVTLRVGHDSGGELTEQLQDLVRGQYGSHAYPRAVHVVDELPKTPSGKIQRFVLRARRRAELASQPAERPPELPPVPLVGRGSGSQVGL